MIVRELEELAVFGGHPAFEKALHVGRPNVGNRDRLLARIEDILDRRWLTNDGPYVQSLERRIARLAGAKHAIAMCNGTIALEIVIRALGLSGEVIVPSFTFVATAHALQWQEIRPVFCDVDRKTHTLDPRRVEELITPKTSGIIGVHLWGRACDTQALQRIAESRGLKLMFDASHALGCTHGKVPLGGFGAAEVFSFHATKVCNSFEGGAVTTNDEELAEKIRLMRNFGFAGKDSVIYLGSNGKMNEVSAAMGLTSIESLEEFVLANRQHHETYSKKLNVIPGISVLQYDNDETNNYHYVVVEVDETRAGLSRDELVRVLEAENVKARRYFKPGAHRMEPYLSYQPQAGLVLPVTEELCERVMCLPTGSSLSAEQVERVCGLIELAVSHAVEVRSRLAEGEARDAE